MTTPSTQDFIDAANLAYRPTIPLPAGWSRLTSDLGDDTTGFYGTAFKTSSNQVIIAFRGTDIGTINTDPQFAIAQILADQQIFLGQSPASYTSALNFTTAAEAAASAQGITAGNVFIDGHSLGAAQAEYVSAQTGLAGETFGGPGIPASTIPAGASSSLNDIVEYGDPVGNYSANPNYEGYLLQSDQIVRYGDPTYIGSSLDRLQLEAAGQLLNPTNSDAQKATGLALFADAVAQHHLLVDYAETLGIPLPGGADSVSASDALAVIQDVLTGGTPVSGGLGSDLLAGTPKADAIRGGLGDDTLVGAAGNDQLFGDDGNDIILGNQGDDTVSAGADNDTVIGGLGNDLLLGNQGNDVVTGNEGDDVVFGGLGDDTVLGNQGQDLLLGNQGNDLVFGGLGDDTIYGGQGNDTIFGDQGNDLMFGNEGRNTFVFNPGDTNFLSGVGTGDVIADFKSGFDQVEFTSGPAATSQNFGSSSVATSDFSAAQAAAQTLINNGDAYAFVTNGVDGYLFADENGDHSIDDAVKLNGASTQASLEAQDIRTGPIA